MKYDAFKKRIAKILTMVHPEATIEPNNGSKLFTVLEKDLHGITKLSSQVAN